MAQFVLKDADIYAGPIEVSCIANNVTIETSAEELDATTFCSDGWKEMVSGLKSWTVNINGFVDYEYESATPYYDASLEYLQSAVLGKAGTFTVAPLGDASTPVYFGTGTLLTYSIGGAVGELETFTLTGSGASAEGLLRGQFLASKAERDGSGTVTAYDNGSALSADAKVYVALHQLNSSLTPGDEIRVVSSSSAGFGTSTTQITYDASFFLNPDHALQTVTGTTHRYWRVEYDLSEPSTFLVVFAIVG